MSAVRVVQLPGAAESKVIQTRGAGRLPKTICRLHVVRYERNQKSHQAQRIAKELASQQKMVNMCEETIVRAKILMSQLRGVEPGTTVATKVCDHLEWFDLPWQEKERLKSMGIEPKEWPL